jgi:hypothetical protein
LQTAPPPSTTRPLFDELSYILFLIRSSSFQNNWRVVSNRKRRRKSCRCQGFCFFFVHGCCRDRGNPRSVSLTLSCWPIAFSSVPYSPSLIRRPTQLYLCTQPHKREVSRIPPSHQKTKYQRVPPWEKMSLTSAGVHRRRQFALRL